MDKFYFFIFLINLNFEGCKCSENDQEGMRPTPAYKALFELYFEKKVCLKLKLVIRACMAQIQGKTRDSGAFELAKSNNLKQTLHL